MAYRTFKDLRGCTFSRWTVIAFAGRNANGGAMWRVRCQCGNERIVFGPNLTRGLSKILRLLPQGIPGPQIRRSLGDSSGTHGNFTPKNDAWKVRQSKRPLAEGL
jgi:hypothetical protein